MSNRIKYLLVGIFIGMAVGGTFAWAATRICIVDDNNNVLGSTGNPLYIISP